MLAAEQSAACGRLRRERPISLLSGRTTRCRERSSTPFVRSERSGCGGTGNAAFGDPAPEGFRRCFPLRSIARPIAEGVFGRKRLTTISCEIDELAACQQNIRDNPAKAALRDGELRLGSG